MLVLPSAATVAPLIGEGLDAVRAANMSLTCLAGLAGLPAVSIPRATAARPARAASACSPLPDAIVTCWTSPSTSR